MTGRGPETAYRFRQALLTSEQEIHLLRSVKAGCKKSRDEIVLRNQRLVSREASRVGGYSKSTGLSVEDLVQEGNIGLLIAVDRFDPERGFRFTTYAVPWVRRNIIRAIQDKARVIRVPVHLHDKFSALDRKAGSQSLGALDKAIHAELRTFLQPVLSLEMKIPGRRLAEMASLGDLIRDPEEINFTVQQRIARRELVDLLKEELTERESETVILHHGLEDGVPLTYEEVAAMLGISRGRIQQLESRAIEKLRKSQPFRELVEVAG